MAKQHLNIVNSVAPDRREFMQRILAVAGFVVPVVGSFSLAPAMRASESSTSCRPTTTSCLGGIGQLGCWPDA